jgi:hypothetical protein
VLSRAPLRDAPYTEKELEKEVQVYVDTIVFSLAATEAQVKHITEAQQVNKTCKKVQQYCLTEWPDKPKLQTDVAHFWHVSAELHMAGDLFLKGKRLVIPQTLGGEILQKIHEEHQGILKCQARAKQSVWWPDTVYQPRSDK